jgi:hypothetical protein
MINIDELHSEVVVDSPSVTPRYGDYADKAAEVRIEELRDIIRALLAEEFERVSRTATIDSGWQG